VKKLCFAVLVHEKREVIMDLLDNIRFFCPNSSIVLFNGGKDPQLCEGLGYPVCPASTRIKWGNLVWYFLHTMEWLEEMNYDYDYLINIDSDAIFAKKGYEEFIATEMEGFDYMAAYFKKPDWYWYPGQTMNNEWKSWQPIFNTKYYMGCFNSAQVFSKEFVQKVLKFEKLDLIKRKLQETNVFALEEILFPTLSDTFGIKSKSYPEPVQRWNRYRPHFTKEEVENGINKQKDCYIVHPVYRDMQDGARAYIRNLLETK
jgi:hypothetical protein